MEIAVLLELADRIRELLQMRLPESLSASGNLKVAITETVSGSGGLTDGELRATPVDVTALPKISSGALTVWNSATVAGAPSLFSVPTNDLATMLELDFTVSGLGFTGGTVTFANPIDNTSQCYGLQLDILSLVTTWSPLLTSATFLFSVPALASVQVYLSTALQGPGTLTITKRACSLPVGLLPALATVLTATPSLIVGQMAPVSQTTEGRLRVDLEATSQDVSGVTTIDTADRQGRRLQEQLALEAYENSLRSLFLADSATSHRMGYEVR